MPVYNSFRIAIDTVGLVSAYNSSITGATQHEATSFHADASARHNRRRGWGDSPLCIQEQNYMRAVRMIGVGQPLELQEMPVPVPGDRDIYSSYANCWFVQFALTYDDPCIVNGRLLVVSKSTAQIVYDE